MLMNGLPQSLCDYANQAKQGSAFNLSCDYWHNSSSKGSSHDFKVLSYSLKLREVSSAPQSQNGSLSDAFIVDKGVHARF